MSRTFKKFDLSNVLMIKTKKIRPKRERGRMLTLETISVFEEGFKYNIEK